MAKTMLNGEDVLKARKAVRIKGERQREKERRVSESQNDEKGYREGKGKRKRDTQANNNQIHLGIRSKHTQLSWLKRS